MLCIMSFVNVVLHYALNHVISYNTVLHYAIHHVISHNTVLHIIHHSAVLHHVTDHGDGQYHAIGHVMLRRCTMSDLDAMVHMMYIMWSRHYCCNTIATRAQHQESE